MDVSALAASLSIQSAMGMLVVKVMDQTQQMIEQQAAALVQNAAISPVSVDGLGENLDISV